MSQDGKRDSKDSRLQNVDMKPVNDKQSIVIGGILVDDETYAARSKSLVRKLDMTLMPMIFILYMFNYLDRNNIAQAKLDNLEKDLGMTGNDFNIVLSIVNVGYMLMQIPSNMLLTRVRPSIYIPCWVCIWACISATCGAAQNMTHMVVIRIFLGLSEAPFFPGVFYLLSCWYTKKELAFRYACLYSGLILATAVSGLLAAGIFAGLGGVAGIPGWRWLFIIEGAITFLLGMVAFVLLPDFPSSTGRKWLFTKEEQEVAVIRMRRDAIYDQQEEGTSIWKGLRDAVKDKRVWIFALMLCSNQSSYGFNYFYPAIVQGFNLGSRTITLVCTAPPYLLAALINLGNAWHSDRKGERGFHIAIPMMTAVVGFIISVSVLNIPARYVASFLYVCGCFGANAAFYSWAASTVAQTPEKKACAMAIINVTGQFGSLWSPYFFDPNDQPRYTRAMILLMAFALLEVSLCFLMKFLLRRENKKILQACEASGSGTIPNLFVL
ncbi:hypothetical protein V2G26_001555 [Clonostachys chloroleuca]